MKNLLTYFSPPGSEKKFTKNYELMMEVQIDNSLIYWKKEDIMVITNFPYEYHGIKAIVVPDSLFCEFSAVDVRINQLIYLIENKILTDTAWVHDQDAFQLAPLDLPPLMCDLGLCTYGYKPNIQYGSSFLKPDGLDVLKMVRERMYERKIHDEDTFTMLRAENFNNINSRIQIMNQTFNIGMRNVRTLLSMSQKPYRVAHFPPFDPKRLNRFRHIMPEKLTKMLDERFTNP